MNPYFYSLHMILTGRMVERQYWSAVDELAEQIADETQPIRPLLAANPCIFNLGKQQ
jgi:hypothetical protein